ncbi:MAG: hypothetical protein AVDCRST_MAG10-457, partial [uncultured Acidimicrobiales bacterium]
CLDRGPPRPSWPSSAPPFSSSSASAWGWGPQMPRRAPSASPATTS